MNEKYYENRNSIDVGIKYAIYNSINKIRVAIADTLSSFWNYLKNSETIDQVIENIFNDKLDGEGANYIKSLDSKNLERFQEKLTDYLIDNIILNNNRTRKLGSQAYEFIKILPGKYKKEIEWNAKNRISNLKNENERLNRHLEKRAMKAVIAEAKNTEEEKKLTHPHEKVIRQYEMLINLLELIKNNG